MARKNPQGAITAFQQAFPIHRQDVELVIKTSNANQFQAQHHQLKTSCANDNRIQWVDQLLSPIAMDQLLVSADVFVSLHRAEGFGLILADAMALGIPVIATGYSGNLEFMPPGSAALVPWQWSVIETNQGDYRKGNRWGEPSLGHAAKAMADLADSAQQRSQLGEAGRRAALERLSEERLVPLVQQRLGTLLQHPSRRELEPPQPLG
jgi:glycosyltransferase involved in cell wall biosynthesis